MFENYNLPHRFHYIIITQLNNLFSGVGKSALVKEFVEQLRSPQNNGSIKKNNSLHSIIYGAGKYSEQNSASSPFFAIIEVLETLTIELCETNDNNSDTVNEQREKVCKSFRKSELIGPGKEGDLILRATFPVLKPLLDSCVVNEKVAKNEDLTVHPTMSAIKECTLQLLCAICRALDNPLIIFLDDLQWADEASIDMLTVLMTSSELKNLMFICAYRSNEVDVEHSFSKLMDNVAKGDESVEKMELFSLSPASITSFIADSVKKEEDDDVTELSSAVYQTTMGNIFFTKQAIEELVRKNILFYDIMCFEWRWVVTKVELANNMSADVVESVLGKIRGLSEEIQQLLSLMAYVPNALDVSTLKALMCRDAASYEESQVLDLLQQSSDEGMLLLVSPNWIFAHDRIRQASLKFASEKAGSEETLLHISSVILTEGDNREWCQYVAVDILNSLPVEKTDCNELVKLNLKVSHLARNSGALGKENALLHKGLESLKSSGRTWKGDYYELTLQLYDALLVSEYSSGEYGMRCH